MSRFAEAIEEARVDVVPRILIGGGAGATTDRERDPRATELRDTLRSALATPRQKARANGDPNAT